MVHLMLTSFTPLSVVSLDYSNDSYPEGNPKQTTPQNSLLIPYPKEETTENPNEKIPQKLIRPQVSEE